MIILLLAAWTIAAVSALAGTNQAIGQPQNLEAVRSLAAEVHAKGWIVFSARSERGDWDLFVCRPDGTERRPLTRTPNYHEAAPQFSRDGQKLLYRRLARDEKIDGNHYGEQGELVIANTDGTNPQVVGKPGEYPWASWSPDGRQIACLSIKGIFVVDLATRATVRRLDRQGFFQQVTWSPDGRWLCGVANSYGTGWSIARLELASGATNAVNRVDCCTPDWFPDSRRVIFSWRPPGQKTNKGYGWTQLWMAGADGQGRQLVYGEDGRHVYGGQVSPDGQYVVFTGNMQENGDPANTGAPMALMRLKDAPIIAGESKDLRVMHPEAKDGPLLTLPSGWEPCWTSAEIGRASNTSTTSESLAREVHDKGWLVFSAKTEPGDWDLFMMRPDGSERRKITDTREFNEAGARFSPDGKRLLYYQMPKAEPVDNNSYGTYNLVIAAADGRNPVVYGQGFHWACWSPDSARLACLTPKGIQIIDIASRKAVRELPRKGIVQQLVWSPDGRWFVGTANGLGPYWNIGRLSVETGEINLVSEAQRYNCTPDWAPDSQHVLYARGIIPNVPGRAELWMASGDGKEKQMLYAEAARNIYGACPSPDGQYLLFTRSVADLGKVDNSQTTMALVRRSDTPMLGDNDESLEARFPKARPGPRLDLGPGWEPHWTFADVARSDKGEAK